MIGDTLRIVRDAQTPAEADEATLFSIRPDGQFAYRYVGTIQGNGRTPEEIAAEISQKLAPIYRYPKVTVNVALAPGNRVFVGGAVRNPTVIDLAASVSLEQAVIAAGGVLPGGDSSHIALMRLDANGCYRVYFSNFKKILTPEPARKAVLLQRGDIVFVPKSAVGNAVDMVDLYLNQLLPFNKSIGLGFTYGLNSNDTHVNINTP